MVLLPLRKVILNQSFKVAVSHQGIFLANFTGSNPFVDLKVMILDNPRYTYL